MSSVKIHQVKKVPIEWDKPRVMQYPFPVLKMLRDEYGLDLLSGSWKAETLEQMASVIWAGLHTDDPGLTEDAVFNMMDIGNLNELTDVMSEALVGEVTVPLPGPSGLDTGLLPDTTLDSPTPSSES